MSMHVVCLDGTGQERPQTDPTNISKIFDALGGVVVDGGNGSWETDTTVGDTLQMGKYLPGVGTQGNIILQTLGKAFGDGIAEQIVRGYTFLSRNYAPGDGVIILGFSRGAAAARALAGFVVTQGVLDKSTYDPTDKDTAYLRAISAWYQYRSADPELANQDRLTSIQIDTGQSIPTLTSTDYVSVAMINCVAVFDTVSSLGVPQVDDNGDAIYDFTICNTVLNPKVARAFHALSADETRDVFAPTYWTARQGIVQQIFPGAHSNVGGGYPETGLSDGALNWMLNNLGPVGMSFSPSLVAPVLAPDALTVARDDSTTWPFRDTPQKPRVFPSDATPNASIIARWGHVTEILPAGDMAPYRSIGTYSGGISIYRPSA